MNVAGAKAIYEYATVAHQMADLAERLELDGSYLAGANLEHPCPQQLGSEALFGKLKLLWQAMLRSFSKF